MTHKSPHIITQLLGNRRLFLDMVLAAFILGRIILLGTASADPRPAFCNQFHHIAVLPTSVYPQYAVKKIQDRLPYGYRLYEVKDEKEAQQEKFCCVLYLNYQTASVPSAEYRYYDLPNEPVKLPSDRLELKLMIKDSSCSSNWAHISEEGRKYLVGIMPSDIHWEGKSAIDMIPQMSMSCNGCESLDVSPSEALKDKDWEVRKEATAKLRGVALIEALNNEDWEVRIVAADTLGGIGDANAVKPLIKLLAENDWMVRRSAVEALGKLGSANAIQPLEKLFKNEHDKFVKKAVQEALARLRKGRK